MPVSRFVLYPDETWVDLTGKGSVTQPQIDVVFDFMFSASPDRSNLSVLNGATVDSESAYVQLVPVSGVTTADITSVLFYFDNIYVNTEKNAPYDFRGANASDVPNPVGSTVGTHTMFAEVFVGAKKYITDTVSFTVQVITQPPPPPEEPPPPPPPTGSIASYWQTNFPVSGGWDLDPRKGIKAGNRPGVTLTPGGSIQANTTYFNKIWTGATVITVPGVKFVNCKFVSSDYKPRTKYGCGTTKIVVLCKEYDAEFIDCEILGGAAQGFTGSSTFTRCYLAEGDDILKTIASTKGSKYTVLNECILDGSNRENADSHTDAIQSTSNAKPDPSTRVDFIRATSCWISVYNRFLKDRGNSCYQLGAFGSDAAGVDGLFSKCVFWGGNITVNCDSGPKTPGVTYKNCRIVWWTQDFDSNPLGSGSRAQFDTTNVWYDGPKALQPIWPNPGAKPGAGYNA